MLLKPEEVEARIKLYSDLRDALADLTNLMSTVPEVCPSDFHVDSDYLNDDVKARADFVIKRAWPALRKAMLADAQKLVDNAEAAVRAFETGEDTNAHQ